MYVNDKPESLENNFTVKMFVEDSKLYKQTDYANGASDLLNNDKVSTARQQATQGYPNTLPVHTAPQWKTCSEEDIDVYTDSKLTFKDQINSNTTKANTIMGIIRTNFDNLDMNISCSFTEARFTPT